LAKKHPDVPVNIGTGQVVFGSNGRVPGSGKNVFILKYETVV
jgi:hypothetical protein